MPFPGQSRSGPGPDFFPLMVSSTLMVLLIGGALSGFFGASSSEPPAAPTPADVASLVSFANAGLIDGGTFVVSDSIQNITTFYNVTSTIRFGSYPGEGFEIAGNHADLKNGYSVRATFYYSAGTGTLYLYDIERA